MKGALAGRAFLAIAVAATGGVEASHSTFQDAPAASRARPNPYAGVADAVAAGSKLFRQHCASCHGQDAAGTRRAPSLRSSVVRGASSGELEWFLRAGKMRSGMPSWSSLSPARRWQIVAFLESLR